MIMMIIFYHGGTSVMKKIFRVPENKPVDKCKGDLKNKPVVGLIFLQDMKKTGNVDEELGEQYAGGTVMDPDKGETFKCKIWVKGNILTLRGYVGFLYETQQWTRVK